jgi:phosphoserine phosphatase RsbU/P
LPASARQQLWDCQIAAGGFPMLDAAREQGQTVARSLRARDKPENWSKLKPNKITEEGRREDARLLIAVPLLIKSEFFGVLLLEEAESAQRFRARRLEIVNGIAQQAALAIQSDRLQGEMVVRERLETEVKLARQIQRAFIPQVLPQFEGWQLAGRWETARQVGGDFYDVIELPGHKIGIFIGDVADKGMPAALFMALTRTLVRAAVVQTTSPAEAMRQVNDLLIPDTGLGMFVTAVYGVVDLTSHQFTYANVGHNPPLWIRRDGPIERLTRTGIALGIIEGEKITERTIQLGEGDTVLLYTDGITEAFAPSGDMFGESALLEVVEATRAADASDLLDAIETRVKNFMESQPLSDDMTMLALKRR